MTGSLEIGRAEFAEAVQLLRKLCTPGYDDAAVLSYDGDCLHIEVGRVRVKPRANGTWPGRVRVRNDFILSFGRLLPSGPRIHVQFERGRLYIGSSSTLCAWEAPPRRKKIEVPANATISDYLCLTFRYSMEELIDSDLGDAVRNAQAWADRTLANAAYDLKDFDITEQELRELAFGRLRERNGKRR